MTQRSKPTVAPLSVVFCPDKQFTICSPGDTLLGCARHSGVKIASACGGRGICKSCIVRYLNGAAPEPTEQDRQLFSATKLAKGWRRACQTVPDQSCRIEVPKRTRAQATRLFEGCSDIWVHPEPVVRAYSVGMVPPSLTDTRSDVERLLDMLLEEHSLECNAVDLSVLRALPSLMRLERWSIQVLVRHREVIAVGPRETPVLGVAIDLGSTNIAVLLVDMQSGVTLASAGVGNPQGIYGSDVIARISHIKGNPELLLELQRITVDAINRTIRTLCDKRGQDPAAIADVVIAGNTVMHHILLGLSVEQLGVAPFTAVTREMTDIKAKDLGLQIAPGAYVHAVANIDGFVGGDHTAMLLGIRADTEQRSVIALDIGTNTEISLLHRGNIYSLSCPSGPALEGGNISCGMRAAKGAIECIHISDGVVKLGTIGDLPPVGLCGSAVLDAVAEFHKVGAINFRGTIDPLSPYSDDSGSLLYLDGDNGEVVFTQEDVRNVQLSKAAIRAGIELLLDSVGLMTEELDRIVIAGAFGMYIRVDSAVAIGMLPALPTERFEQVGNAAGIGAKLALLSDPLRQVCRSLAGSSHYREQAGCPDFMRHYMAHIHLPRTDNQSE